MYLQNDKIELVIYEKTIKAIFLNRDKVNVYLYQTCIYIFYMNSRDFLQG